MEVGNRLERRTATHGSILDFESGATREAAKLGVLERQPIAVKTHFAYVRLCLCLRINVIFCCVVSDCNCAQILP